MIEVLGVLANAPWPVWVGGSGMIVLLTLARLVMERARRQTYHEILVQSTAGTVLIDRHQRRYLVLYRPVATPQVVVSARWHW